MFFLSSHFQIFPGYPDFTKAMLARGWFQNEDKDSPWPFFQLLKRTCMSPRISFHWRIRASSTWNGLQQLPSIMTTSWLGRFRVFAKRVIQTIMCHGRWWITSMVLAKSQPRSWWDFGFGMWNLNLIVKDVKVGGIPWPPQIQWYTYTVMCIIG